MKSRFLLIISPSDTPNPTEKCENTVAPVWNIPQYCNIMVSFLPDGYKPVCNSVQYYTIIHSFLPDGYGIVSNVYTIQITLAQYSVISKIRPNFLLDLSICPVLMRLATKPSGL